MTTTTVRPGGRGAAPGEHDRGRGFVDCRGMWHGAEDLPDAPDPGVGATGTREEAGDEERPC